MDIKYKVNIRSNKFQYQFIKIVGDIELQMLTSGLFHLSMTEGTANQRIRLDMVQFLAGWCFCMINTTKSSFCK